VTKRIKWVLRNDLTFAEVMQLFVLNLTQLYKRHIVVVPKRAYLNILSIRWTRLRQYFGETIPWRTHCSRSRSISARQNSPSPSFGTISEHCATRLPDGSTIFKQLCQNHRTGASYHYCVTVALSPSLGIMLPYLCRRNDITLCLNGRGS